jgi:hypothetical protein
MNHMMVRPVGAALTQIALSGESYVYSKESAHDSIMVIMLSDTKAEMQAPASIARMVTWIVNSRSRNGGTRSSARGMRGCGFMVLVVYRCLGAGFDM